MRLLYKVVKDYDFEVETSYFLNRDIEIIAVSSEPCEEEAEQKAIEKANEKADEIIEKAKTEAAKIVRDAQEHIKKMNVLAKLKIKTEMEAAQKSGYENGLKQGREEVLAKSREMLEEVAALVNSLDDQRDHVLREYEIQILDLAVDVAQKITELQLDRNDDAFLNIYKKAVQDFRDQDWIRVSVSSNELEFATQNRELLKELVRGAKYIEIIELPEAPKGTCIVESAKGIADASVDVQIEKIKDELLKVRAS